jgi:hypothetical protein
MILNVAEVLAGTIWDTGPHAVALALLPLVVGLVGLVLRDPSDVRSSAGLAASVRPALAGATPALRTEVAASPNRGALRKQSRLALARTCRALAAALDGGRR